MPSDSRVILASAGSGKTTSIVCEAGANPSVRAEVVTYTLNGRRELVDAAYREFGCVPRGLRVGTWFSFVLQHFVRPYQAHLHPHRAVSIDFSEGAPPRYLKKQNVGAYYFSRKDRLRRDRVTEFACTLIESTGGLPIERFAAICDHFYIDEAQDLSGYDLDFIELLLKSGIRLTLIGDCRQATFTTNNNRRNRAYLGANITKKFDEWEKGGLLTVDHQFYSHRCVQEICDFADSFYPEIGATRSLNEANDPHMGVFVVRERDLETYIALYSPQPLRYSRATKVDFGPPINFGAAKGMTFDRVLIYPHGPLKKYLSSGEIGDVQRSIPKTYVAVTRARTSVAFVVENNIAASIVPIWEPPR